MKRLIAIFLATAALSSPALAGGMPRNLSCIGILERDGESLELGPRLELPMWCDSAVSSEFTGAEAYKRVTNACQVGQRCRIVGVVHGHGAFYWIKIKSVAGMK
jgi:hypothetical protein